MRHKLLKLGPSEPRNLRTHRPGGSVVRTERNETRFVLAKVKSQSRLASGEWRSRMQVSESNDSPTSDQETAYSALTIRFKA